jgi:hypothetical protein
MLSRRTEAETVRAAPSGRWILAADGCVSTSSDPAYCSCAVWGPGEAGGVAVAMFGHTGLDMLICRIADVTPPYTYAPVRMSLTVTAIVNSSSPLVWRTRPADLADPLVRSLLDA